ncbi:hypothetical protein Acor_55860 [Acrocarpospora corrugata]|uniref:Uncharacterized protein n=1 Tax=Acrocarpospora corrugata TaxID=35763 RepID=A0A5M3W5J1_9ACTN|nr:hypothetical protein [Acrocarpospora corrugata]GES03520.1 hypothetical protein Acor_55860 [Acrocarpospora corrugata]
MAEQVRNQIQGGVFLASVVQGRDITVQLPAEVPPALSGLPPEAPGFVGRQEGMRALLGLWDPGAASATRVPGCPRPRRPPWWACRSPRFAALCSRLPARTWSSRAAPTAAGACMT